MSEFTLEEKTRFEQTRAAEKVAEEHFYDAAQPFYPLGFSVIHRNPGHWDVIARETPGHISAWLASHPGGSTSGQDGGRVRAFRIRGEPGNVQVIDERWNPRSPPPRDWMTFRSVMAAMLWIAEELMQEPPK